MEAVAEKVSKKVVNKGKKAVEKKANALERLVVEYVAVGDIKPNAYNPNRQSEHDFELLKKSMGEDGFTQPVIVQADTMTIVDGEHRWRCAQALGYKEIPIVKVSMTLEQMRIATLRHNRARGSEDIELTSQVLRDLREMGALAWAQDSLMMDDTEMQKMIDDIQAPDALAGAEYGDAWAPGETGVTRADSETASVNMSGMTAAATDAVRAQEKAMAMAKTQEEKDAIKRDTGIYRVALVFAAEEAALVKRVLGDKPAAKVLEMCRQWGGSTPGPTAA